MRRLTVTLSLAILSLCVPRDAAAQLDPLLFIKNANGLPNVLIAVDTSNRMQRDPNNDYLDANIYTKSGSVLQTWETISLGMTPDNTTSKYRRKYIGLTHKDTTTSGDDKFTATRLEIVGDGPLHALEFARFDERTRLTVARRGLIEAIDRNKKVARFGLVRMRQDSPRLGSEKNETVTIAAQDLGESGTGGRWRITRPEVNSLTNSEMPNPVPGIAAGAPDSNGLLDTLKRHFRDGTSGGLTPLTPGGRDSKDKVDAPIDTMLVDLRNEAAKSYIEANTMCRNTVAILVLGGWEGNTAGSLGKDPAATALQFLNVGANHRVPIHVIAITPRSGLTDAEGNTLVSKMQSIATNSGGMFTEITKEMIDRATAAGQPVGQPVPEFVRAVNQAVQHAFVPQSTFDVDPSPTTQPYGLSVEHQVTSPIIGTVNLQNAPTLGPAGPITDGLLTKNGTEIPQRSNLLVTTGFTLPGFTGSMRAFRVYKPVVDSTRPSGYKFVADGTPVWVAKRPDPVKRNIYTSLPDGTVVAFTEANAGQLQEYLRTTDLTATTQLIRDIRNQELGAVVGSTPAIMDPPSLDPPPDAIYPKFSNDNKLRRSLVWVGANDGMLHAIDARLGCEVWAFIPFNLLPKLKTLQSGQPVGDFRYFVDSSPKIADVRIAGVWRTYLIMGEGAGGTFYQTFDVTLDGIGTTVAPDENNVDVVLSYFARPESVPLKWSFPRYSAFDWTLAPWGDISANALAVEKTVGETWSDPAVGQIEGPGGKFAVLTGSGFFKWSLEQQANRNQIAAGSTFYLLDVETGAVFDSRDVGNDNKGETVDNCVAVNNCSQLKNALQADPVATGPPDSRFVTKAYIGDLDGKIWRFDIGLDTGGIPKIKGLVSLYTVNTGSGTAANHPIFASMATVNVGGTKQYLFVGTGSDLLPSNGVSVPYALLVILDNGASGSKTFHLNLTRTDGLDGDEKVSAFPAVAGDIVFFTTTTYMPSAPCSLPTGSLYGFTFIGGPAYDTTNDGRLTTADTQKIATTTGRATAPFIADQHLLIGGGGKLKMFGDPEDFNNGVGQVGVRILSWREVR